MKTIVMRIKENIEKLTLLLAVSIMALFTSPVYCDKLEEASKAAAEGIQESAQGAAKWLLVIMIAIGGVTFIIGSTRQRENAKERAPGVLVGVGMIVCAIPLALLIFDWF